MSLPELKARIQPKHQVRKWVERRQVDHLIAVKLGAMGAVVNAQTGGSQKRKDEKDEV